MDKSTLDAKLKELEEKYESDKKDLIREYCIKNNPYKIGDKFTDHIGTILIDDIQYGLSVSLPACVYFGVELKKDGTPRKDGSRRRAWQLNEVKK